MDCTFIGLCAEGFRSIFFFVLLLSLSMECIFIIAIVHLIWLFLAGSVSYELMHDATEFLMNNFVLFRCRPKPVDAFSSFMISIIVLSGHLECNEERGRLFCPFITIIITDDIIDQPFRFKRGCMRFLPNRSQNEFYRFVCNRCTCIACPNCRRWFFFLCHIIDMTDGNWELIKNSLLSTHQNIAGRQFSFINQIQCWLQCFWNWLFARIS